MGKDENGHKFLSEVQKKILHKGNDLHEDRSNKNEETEEIIRELIMIQIKHRRKLVDTRKTLQTRCKIIGKYKNHTFK